MKLAVQPAISALFIGLQRGELNLLSKIVNRCSKRLSVVRIEDFGSLDSSSGQWQFNSGALKQLESTGIDPFASGCDRQQVLFLCGKRPLLLLCADARRCR